VASEAKKRGRKKRRVVIPENEKGFGGGNLMTLVSGARKGPEEGMEEVEGCVYGENKWCWATEGSRRSANLNLAI